MYVPAANVSDPVVQRELERISQAFFEFIAGRLDVSRVEPEKPTEGDIAICDGSDWDPLSDGIKRPVWFDGSSWAAFGSGGGGGVTDHGALTGLADDDHPQYPLVAGTETITGGWSFELEVGGIGGFISSGLFGGYKFQRNPPSGTDENIWEAGAGVDSWALRTLDDVDGFGENAILITRTGVQVVRITLSGDAVQIDATLDLGHASDTTLSRISAGVLGVEGVAVSLTGHTHPLSEITGDGALAALNTVGTSQIDNDAVTFGKLQNIATARLLGRITAATGDVEELTGTQATTLLDAFTSALKGLVPASGGGTTNYLRADGTWAVPAGTGTTLDHGTYTPTLTGVVNVAASTAYACQYMRVGNTVTVSGKLDITPTSASISTVIDISLPIASDFASDNQCAGCGHETVVANSTWALQANATNNRAAMNTPVINGGGSREVFFTFTYLVI